MRPLIALLVLAAGCDEPRKSRRGREPDPSFPLSPDAEPRNGQPIDPLPPGAHQNFPTPRRAGTEDLFFVEEPVRGPHVTKLAMPDRKTLAFELRAYCEIDELTVVCGKPAAAARDLASVSVGKHQGRPVLIEWKAGTHVEQTVVMSYNAAGDLERMARLDVTGTIDWVRTYAPAGKRYTARELNGRNALPGCGSIDLTIDNGRVTGRTCLRWLGDEMRDTNGVVTTTYERDVDGFVVVEQRLGFGGRLVAGQRDFVHRIETARDDRGRPTKNRFLAVAGHPVGSADSYGCHGADYHYERNQESRRRCLDDAGRVAPDEDGVAVIVTDRDREGCAVANRYLDAGGQPTTRDGIHELRDAYDVRCQEVSNACLGLGGAKVACGPGQPAEYRYIRDAHGRVTSTTYLDEAGSRTGDPSYGASELRQTYDDLGNRLEEACFDASGFGMDCGNTGFHRKVDVYDPNGRAIEERFYAGDGSAATNMGTVVRKYVYDNYDHLSESQDYDASGQLFEVQGMAIKRNYYDDSHRLFGIVLLDARGKPSMYSSCYTGVYCPGNATIPWHAVRLVRSPMGRIISNEYFDTDGQLIEAVDCKQLQCWED